MRHDRGVSQQRIRRERTAVAALFFTNGALFANLVPRFPEIKADLQLSNTAFGLSIAAFSAGALLSGLTAAALIRRFGPGGVAVFSSLLLGALTVVVGVAPTSALFAVALFVAGSADAVTDVGQNATGLSVQREYGRSIINSLHATWSVGAISGGAVAAAAMALGVPRVWQLPTVAVACAVVCLLSLRALSDVPVVTDPAAKSQERGASGTAVPVALAALAALAIAGAFVEDAGSSWATLYLGQMGAPPALAAGGFIALVSFQFVGRLIGDRLVDRFSERTVVRAGGVLIAVGMGTALAFPTVPMTVVGFALAGLGVASAVPAAFHGADRVAGLRPGTGLTIVSWLMRGGFLLSPVLVGALADAASLRFSLLSVVVAGVAIAVLATALAPVRRGPSPSAGSPRHR
ncbi:fucose permease [Mycolicibacterium confluentis]|nr:fucose permease [Mycolicibacterium confluentis]